MTEDVFESLLKTTSTQYQSTGYGLGLVQRIHTLIPQLIEGLIWQVVPVVIETAAAFFVIVKFTDAYVASILVLIIFCYFSCLAVSVKIINKSNEALSSAANTVLSRFVDSFKNQEVVKLYRGYKIEKEKLRKEMQAKENASRYANLRNEATGLFQFAILGIGLTGLTMMLIYKITVGEIQVSDLVLTNSYLLQFTLPLGYFGFVITGIRKGILVLKEALALEKSKASFVDSITINHAKKKEQSQYKGLEIVFEDASIECNKVKILDRVSGSIPAGLVTGIGGLSGNGKTSLIKSMLKLLPLTEGSIYLNREPISEMSIDHLHSFFSVASQDIQVFEDTILANITYGSASVPQVKIDQILKITNLEELVAKLPGGLNAIIKSEPACLSKGELQRIAIARCLLREADIYIFDEPTSSLDVKNGKEIIKNIINYLKGKTVVIITHQLSIFKEVDNILLINRGKVERMETQAFSEIWFKK